MQRLEMTPRQINSLLDKQGIMNLKVLSNKDKDKRGRVYKLKHRFSNGDETLLLQSVDVMEVLDFLVINCGLVLDSNNTQPQQQFIINDVETFNEWLQSPEMRFKNIRQGTMACEWQLEMIEHKELGKMYTLVNKKVGRYWFGDDFFKCSTLNILEWIEIVCLFADNVCKPKYTGEIIKADTLSNANKLLYIKGVNKGEDWHNEFKIEQRENKYVAIIHGRVMFEENTPGQCLKHIMHDIEYGYPKWIYE